MDLLKQIIAQAADVEQAKLYESIDQSFDALFDKCEAFAKEQNDQIDESVAAEVAAVMGKDVADQVDREDAPLSLKESLDAEFLADVAVLESVSDLTIVGMYDQINEDFEAAVQRILKSDRKLRMTSKDGKTKYKTRRRAAEAAAAASMAAVFGKRGVSAKAKAGKKG